MKQLVIASHNAHKVDEIRQILAGEPVELLSLSDIGWHEEIIENGSTFEENSRIKAMTVFEKTGLSVLADDSGLEVDALGGAPGVYSARYMGEETPYRIKCAGLMIRLAGMPDAPRTARFRCTVTFVRPDAEGEPVIVTREGSVEGEIARRMEGSGGFGYDPALYLPERGCTMAQLSAAEKNEISHRGRAIRAVLPEILGWLSEENKQEELT